MSEKVLGLDLANNLGISVLDSSKPEVIYSDSLKLSKTDAQKKLIRLRDIINDVITEHAVSVMAIEDIFLPARTSPKTPISLGELRGVARLCAADKDLPVFFYSPRKVKLAVTGYGNATKKDVIHWIESEFKIKVKDDNEADAISIALTHILTSRFNSDSCSNFF